MIAHLSFLAEGFRDLFRSFHPGRIPRLVHLAVPRAHFDSAETWRWGFGRSIVTYDHRTWFMQGRPEPHWRETVVVETPILRYEASYLFGSLQSLEVRRAGAGWLTYVIARTALRCRMRSAGCRRLLSAWRIYARTRSNA